MKLKMIGCQESEFYKIISSLIRSQSTAQGVEHVIVPYGTSSGSGSGNFKVHDPWGMVRGLGSDNISAQFKIWHLLVKKADDHDDGLLVSRIGNSLRTVIPNNIKEWCKKKNMN